MRSFSSCERNGIGEIFRCCFSVAVPSVLGTPQGVGVGVLIRENVRSFMCSVLKL